MNTVIRWFIVLIILGLFAVGVAINGLLPSGYLRVIFLDVGQGDSVVIETPLGQRLVIDGGPDTSVLHQLGSRLTHFDRRIDALILTHPDLDHLNGLVELIRRYDVGAVILTGVVHESAAYDAFFVILKQRRIPVFIPQADLRIPLGAQTELTFLWPTKNLVGQKPDISNNSSIVTYLTHNQRAFLLTGDAYVEVELEVLTAHPELKVDILQLGHHGSKTSSGQTFLRRLLPKLALISAGHDNKYGHPAPEVTARLQNLGIPWLLTAESGTVEITSDGSALWVKSGRGLEIF